MDLSLRSIKTDTVTTHFTSLSCSLEPAISHGTLVSGYLFDSCQLTIRWMSIIKLNTDWICLEHLLASKCDISHLLTLSLPKFLVCTDTVTKFYYPLCFNATGAPLRNFYMTHVSAFDILNPSAGDVGAKKSNGKIWTQYNFWYVYSHPFPSKKIGRGRRVYSASLNPVTERLKAILKYFSLRSKRFQSSYCTKFGARMKEIEDWRRRTRGKDFPSLPSPSLFIPLFCTRPNFLNELACKRLLRGLEIAGRLTLPRICFQEWK